MSVDEIKSLAFVMPERTPSRRFASGMTADQLNALDDESKRYILYSSKETFDKAYNTEAYRQSWSYKSPEPVRASILGAPDSEGEIKQARMCMSADAGASELASNRVDTLSRIIKSEQEEKKHQLRLSKNQKVRFRKNRLWDKKQKNGPVIRIDPKDYLKNG